MSFACAFAWDYNSLLAIRFLQGLGLGGEIPIMATYINEFAKAERRGRFSLGYQVLLLGRAIGDGARGLVGRADLRLALDVRDRRGAGVPRHSAARGSFRNRRAGSRAVAARGGRPRA